MARHGNHPHSVTGYSIASDDKGNKIRDNNISGWDDTETGDNDGVDDSRMIRVSSHSLTESMMNHSADDSWESWGDDSPIGDDGDNDPRNEHTAIDDTGDNDIIAPVTDNADSDDDSNDDTPVSPNNAFHETNSETGDSEERYNDAWGDLIPDDLGDDEWDFAISDDTNNNNDDNNDDTGVIESEDAGLNDSLDGSLNDDPSEDIVSPDAIAVTDDAITNVASVADGSMGTSGTGGDVDSDVDSDVNNSMDDGEHGTVAADDKPESLPDAPSSIDEYMDADNDADNDAGASPLSYDEEDLNAIKNATIDAGVVNGDTDGADGTDLDDLLDEGPGEASLLDVNHHEHNDNIDESSSSRDTILDDDYPDDMDDIITDSELAKRDVSDAGMTLSLHKEYDYYDLNAAAGMPIWVDEDTLEFIFSIRYNSPAFDGSLLQEDYRVMVHKSFSDLIRTLIQQKLDMMSRRPNLYKNASMDDGTRRQDPNADAGFMDPIASIDSLMDNLDDDFDDDLNDSTDNADNNAVADSAGANGSKLMSGYRLDTIDKDGIIDIATGMGIDPASIDVLTLIADVVESLSKIVVKTIEERPGMNPAEKQTAILFMRSQLWNENAQLRWRAVSANMLAAMYSYEALPISVKIIRALDALISEEMRGGSLQASSLTTTFMNEWLSDAVIQYVMHAIIENPDTTPELMIDEAIEDIRTGDWQNP